jgi:hypothetical protein
MIKKLAAVALAALFFVPLLASSASAHAGDQSYVYLTLTEDTLSGQVEFPFADAREVFGLSLDGTPEENQAEIDANAQLLVAYADEHFDLGTGGAPLPVVFQTDEVVELFDGEGVSIGYIIMPFTVDTGGQAPPREYDVRFDPFFDEIEGRDALLLIANDWGGGTIENDEDFLVAFNAGSREQTVDLGDSAWYRTVTASMQLGVDHIRTGPDHIFFVMVLLLPSVLVFSTARRWKPGVSFGSSLWRVLKIVSMFTLAHTITFTLAGMDLLPTPSSKIVESIIALSIAAAALHNIRPIAANREWAIAFGFGLFHGMGFASLIADLDVSRSTQLISLLGRNIGIELGQVAVILMAFPMLFLLRRTRYYLPGFTFLSIALAVVSVVWMFERIFERETGINDIVDRVLKFPRILVIMAVLTAIAAVVRQYEASKDRLLPVYTGADDAPADREPALTGV